MPFISVNVLSWNRKNDLIIILNKIKGMNYPKDKFEIIVVDNASMDGAPQTVERNFPEVKLIKRRVNNGIGGWNDGFALAKGDYVMVLDDDAYPEPDACYKVAEFFEQHPQTGVLALGIVLGFEGEKVSEYPGDETIAVGFGGGTSVIRKKAIEEAGLYDEHLFIGAHEFDYAVRVLDKGFAINYAPHIKVFHKEAGAYHKDERYIYYTTRNKLWVTWKYFPLHAVLVSNFIWVIHSFLLSLAMKAFGGFCRSLKDAFAGMGYLRKTHSRRHLVNNAVTKRLLRRFNLKVFINGVRYIFNAFG